MSIGISAALGAEVERLRAELAEARKLDCRTCDVYDQCYDGSRSPCDSGTGHVSDHAVRLYEIDAAMVGGE